MEGKLNGKLPFQSYDTKKIPRSRVELHLHLEGAFRAKTIWELSKAKNLDLGFSNLDELKSFLQLKEPETLKTFLDRIIHVMPVFTDDPEAIERAAYELCEDEALQGVLYFEVRFAPQPLSGKNIDSREVVRSVNRGLRRGEKQFNIKARIILCCLLPLPNLNEEVLNLCVEFQNDGVVGIDIAGDEANDDTAIDVKQKCVFDLFKRAEQLGIHRTVHAGEVGTSKNVEDAMKYMYAERLGHAYRCLQDPKVYAKVLETGIHVECCPHSSIYTGAVPITNADKHAIIRFAEDGANFSISKDDPMVTGSTLDDEYRILREMGLKESHFVKANFSAAAASFLPPAEKKQLIQDLSKAYGIENYLNLDVIG